MIYKCVGQRIRELREIKQYTREMLAKKIDISAKYLYEIEYGKKNFSADILCRIAKSLSVSCDYIMFGNEVSVRKEDNLTDLISKLDAKDLTILQEMLKNLYNLCDVL